MYEIEDDAVPPPPLPGQVVMSADADEAIEQLGLDLVEQAGECVRNFGDFHLALSGGDLPGRLYRRLMYAPEFRWIPWRRTHLWFTSERPVGLEDPRSNFRLVDEFIGDHADLPPEQMHPILAESPTAAEDYEARLRERLSWRDPGERRLDFVLLTVDPTGGVAGLTEHARILPPVAGSPPPDDGRRLVARLDDAEDPVGCGVSMLPELINDARFVAILAAGPDAAGGLAAAAVGPGRPDIVASVRSIRPRDGELRWYVDPVACRHILPDASEA